MKADLSKDREQEMLECMINYTALLQQHGISVDLNVNYLRGSCRRQEVVLNRCIAVFILSKKGYISIDIAAFLNRDHATILYLRKVFRNKQYQKDLKEEIELIIKNRDTMSMILYYKKRLRELENSLKK